RVHGHRGRVTAPGLLTRARRLWSRPAEAGEAGTADSAAPDVSGTADASRGPVVAGESPAGE
ncbi:AI-2E family transporter, partial [Streptomyces spiralis]